MESQLKFIKKNIRKSYIVKKKFKSKLEKLYSEHKLIKYIKKNCKKINLEELMNIDFVYWGWTSKIEYIIDKVLELDTNCDISDKSLSNFITNSKLISNNECIICYDKTHVYSLTCSDKHMVCPECYDQLYDHNGWYKKCPFCREPSYEIPFVESFIEHYFD